MAYIPLLSQTREATLPPSSSVHATQKGHEHTLLKNMDILRGQLAHFSCTLRLTHMFTTAPKYYSVRIAVSFRAAVYGSGIQGTSDWEENPPEGLYIQSGLGMPRIPSGRSGGSRQGEWGYFA